MTDAERMVALAMQDAFPGDPEVAALIHRAMLGTTYQPEPAPMPVNATLKPERVETGVYPSRRRLTLPEAERGALPTPFTAEEWRRMRDAAAKPPLRR